MHRQISNRSNVCWHRILPGHHPPDWVISQYIRWAARLRKKRKRKKKKISIAQTLSNSTNSVQSARIFQRIKGESECTLLGVSVVTAVQLHSHSMLKNDKHRLVDLGALRQTLSINKSKKVKICIPVIQWQKLQKLHRIHNSFIFQCDVNDKMTL